MYVLFSILYSVGWRKVHIVKQEDVGGGGLVGGHQAGQATGQVRHCPERRAGRQ